MCFTRSRTHNLTSCHVPRIRSSSSPVIDESLYIDYLPWNYAHHASHNHDAAFTCHETMPTMHYMTVRHHFLLKFKIPIYYLDWPAVPTNLQMVACHVTTCTARIDFTRSQTLRPTGGKADITIPYTRSLIALCSYLLYDWWVNVAPHINPHFLQS